MKKKIASSILAILIAFSLTACSSDEEEAPPSPQDSNSKYLNERQYVLDNGRTVTCITYKSYNAGGVTCDWGGVR